MNLFQTARSGLAAASLGAALTLATPLAAQSSASSNSEFADDLPPQDWLNTIERTEKGYRNGNPKAEAELIEFISYTCMGCAYFARQADSTLDVAAVGPGFVSIEVRPVIRNWLDTVVSLLVQCGEPDGFKMRHRAFLYSRDTWYAKAQNAPQGQKLIWQRNTPASRVNAAQALDLDDVMQDRGFSGTQINNCLRDEAAAKKIKADDEANRAEFGVPVTPSFALDGKALAETHDWPTLARVLQERFRPKPQESVTGG